MEQARVEAPVNTSPMLEFSPDGKRDFPHARWRARGSPWWLSSHLFHGRNKFFFIIAFTFLFLNNVLYSTWMVAIGDEVGRLVALDLDGILYRGMILLLHGISVPTCVIIYQVFRERLANRVEQEVREEFYSSLLGKSQSVHEHLEIGNVMAMATNDVRMINYMVSPGLFLLMDSLITLAMPFVVILARYPPELLFSPILFVVLFSIAVRWFVKRLTPLSDKMQNAFGDMHSWLNEALSGIDIIKLCSQESRILESYKKKAREIRDLGIKVGDVNARYWPALVLSLVLTVSLVHSALLFLQPGSGLSIGDLMGYLLLLGNNLRSPTYMSTWVFNLLSNANAGAKRLISLMETRSEIDENPSGLRFPIKGKVTFENVWFTYPGSSTPVLKDISFTLDPGQKACIVGVTGSGKTTLAKLLLRLYDVQEGRVLVDGHDVRDFNISSLREQVSYIEQDVFLFSRSVRENIAFSKSVDEGRIRDVARAARAHEFISAMPGAYESEIGERGVQLSGGERQRIAIARTFLSNPRILIMDDATSAIDSRTEDQIQAAMEEIMKGRTTLLITHRLSQIRWADLVIVLDGGKVVAKGTHDELMRSCEQYRKIFATRFGIDDFRKDDGGRAPLTGAGKVSTPRDIQAGDQDDGDDDDDHEDDGGQNRGRGSGR